MATVNNPVKDSMHCPVTRLHNLRNINVLALLTQASNRNWNQTIRTWQISHLNLCLWLLPRTYRFVTLDLNENRRMTSSSTFVRTRLVLLSAHLATGWAVTKVALVVFTLGVVTVRRQPKQLQKLKLSSTTAVIKLHM